MKYGFYSAEWDPIPHGTAFPMGEGTYVRRCIIIVMHSTGQCSVVQCRVVLCYVQLFNTLQ